VPVLPETPVAAQFVEEFLAAEREAAQRGEIALIGWRVVAVPLEA
jgi:hypothetical protein